MSRYIWVVDESSLFAADEELTKDKDKKADEKNTDENTDENADENTDENKEDESEDKNEENSNETENNESESGEDKTGIDIEISQKNLDDAKEDKKSEGIFGTVFLIAGIAVAVFAAGLISAIFLKRKKFHAAKSVPPAPSGKMGAVEAAEIQASAIPASPILGNAGKVHNIGRRKSQQDSLGVAKYKNGVFAVVADGMGGLSDGDKVSQKIVMTMLQDAAGLTGGSTDGMLYQMVSHANREVNHMLGAADRYKSGSTLIAVLAEAGNFQWVSVGDSRIYLYRAGQILQINREHIYEADLMRKAVNQEISFSEIAKDSQKKSVASFIGMGSLKYIDGSTRRISVQTGDKVVLMSDGVFNTLSEKEICDVLAHTKNAEQAAQVMEEQVLARQNPKQDNFTAIILDI